MSHPDLEFSSGIVQLNVVLRGVGGRTLTRWEP